MNSAKLVVSFVGMQTAEIPAKFVVIGLQDSDAQISEVVVTAVGTEQQCLTV